MYDIIYDYIKTYIFNSTALTNMTSSINGMTLDMNEWLSHTTTIICMALIVCFAIWFVRWVFKFVGGLFILK